MVTISPSFTKNSEPGLASSVVLGATTELENMWDQLAKRLTDAGKVEASVQQTGDPKLVRDPAVVVVLQWLNVFQTDLNAVASVVDAVKAGADLEFDDIQAAIDVGQRLVDLYDSAQEQVADAKLANGAGAAP